MGVAAVTPRVEQDSAGQVGARVRSRRHVAAWQVSLLVPALAIGLAACSGANETEPVPAADAGSTAADAGSAGVGAECDKSEWVRSSEAAFRARPAFVRVTANEQVVVAISSSAVYRSADGLEWERGQGLPEEWEPGEEWDLSDGFPRIGPDSVAGGANGFVAVGSLETVEGESPMTLVVAFSPDGADWEEVDPGSLPMARVGSGVDVFSGPGGFVIAGQDPEGGLFSWFSSDGRAWAASNLPAVEAGRAVMTAADAGWVALTAESPGESAASARVWTSSDGLDWSEVQPSSAPPAWDGDAGAHLAVRGDTWMLAPTSGPLDPTVWVSVDQGVTWDENDVHREPGSGWYVLNDLDVTEDGFVLVGSHDVDQPELGRVLGSGDDGFLGTSRDGASWDSCWTGKDITQVAALAETTVLFEETGSVYVVNSP